ncbi:MAG: recombinase family protein [Cyanobacteria bacterium]|nr:recombinase family protein [Cyanobacteriota bacterium]
MTVAIYARYSSDNQREASIADQFRVCREYAQRKGWKIAKEYSDHAMSGATLLRPGFQAMMQSALRKEVEVVLAESLDRFSRDQEDTAGLFKRLTFAGVSIETISEGDITFLHIGLKGTMNAMYLSELADKTRRGLRGRIEIGRAGGGLCYGYRVLRRIENGTATTGEREIVEEEAAVIRRIFHDYAAGASPKQICKALNAEAIPGPQGALWGPSTIHGNPKRGIGILHNELYVGRLVWNRQRFLKDPDNGKRVARPNPESAWIIKDVPALRIVDDETWKAVRDRYASVQRKWSAAAKASFNQFRRPKYLFSGLTKCGQCGAGFIVHSREQLGCFGARDRGTCSNNLRISRLDVESRVLGALQTKLLRKDFFEEFCREFAKEMNRLRMEQRAGLNMAKRELSKVETRRKKLLDLMLDDVVSTSEGKEEMLGLTARRDELQHQIKTAHEPPPLLHPSMADLYRTKVEQLAAALQADGSRLEASEALRGLIDSIVLTPHEGQLRIELRGNLAAMLAVAQETKRSPETGDLVVPVQLVAGGGFEPPTFGL